MHAAFDRLARPWALAAARGDRPVGFRSTVESRDSGWHIDVRFGAEAPDFMSWRANTDAHSVESHADIARSAR